MPSVFDPIRIGSLTLRNRIVFPPMTTGYEDRGEVTPRSRNFYRTLAAGGAGLIVLGDLSIQPASTPIPMLYDDRFIPGLQSLTAAVHEQDALISAQLFHQEYDAAQITALLQSGNQQAARAQLQRDMEDFCNRLTLEEIERIQELFVAAARRAYEAGFDMIQIHGDRLLGMFSSPLLNRRKDAYGGTLEKRARFALEVVRKIHAALPDMPLDYKLAIIRTDPPRGKGGPTLDEACIMAGWLVEAGISTFHVSQANHSALADVIPPAGAQPYGCFTDLARAVKNAVNVPITTVGRIVTPELADGLVRGRLADMVALGRSLICDPEWPRKAQSGRTAEIRPCIMCNHACTDRLTQRRSIGCIQSPAVGAEPPIEITPAETPRHIVVIGGGPAGMEAARIAAIRGHRVTLLEKEPVLGGQLRLACLPPGKEEMEKALKFQIQELQRLKVNVQLRWAGTPELLPKLQADAVILATGARPQPLPLPGSDRQNIVQAWDVLAGTATVGPRVVVIGGGFTGLGVTLYLAARRHRIALIELQKKIDAGESPTMMPTFNKMLADYDVYRLPDHTITAIDDAGVHVEGPNHTETLACDTIVAAVGAQPDRRLAEALEQAGIPFISIGDCEKVGQLETAIHSGFQAGLKV